MDKLHRWRLPDGIDEFLPGRAAPLEALRRRVLDLYGAWGYQLVEPPLVEFTDSLLEGVGADLDTLTFKVPDQPSGRTLGIRADITPQVARIDAHALADDGISRLCYCGPTLHARQLSPLASRSPVQAGAEIFGAATLAADVEVINLMLATLATAGFGEAVTLDLGHGDICGELLAALELPPAVETAVFDALQRKSRPDLEAALAEADERARQALLTLLNLHGDAAVLARAEAELVPVAPAIAEALAALRVVAERVASHHRAVDIYFDLAELRGYHYHTGIVFAAYLPAHGVAVANGGRYDNVGRAYGRARPATGFATDLKTLVQLQLQLAAGAAGVPRARAIAAPAGDDPALLAAIERLRAAGEVVVVALAEERDPRCDRELVASTDGWAVRDCAADNGRERDS